MKTPIKIQVALIALLMCLMLVALTLWLFYVKREIIPQKTEKVALRRLNELQAVIIEDRCGYSIYVDDKFYDSRTY